MDILSSFACSFSTPFYLFGFYIFILFDILSFRHPFFWLLALFGYRFKKLKYFYSD